MRKQQAKSQATAPEGKKKRRWKGFTANPIVLKQDWSKRRNVETSKTAEKESESKDLGISHSGRFVFGPGGGSMSRRVFEESLQSYVD